MIYVISQLKTDQTEKQRWMVMGEKGRKFLTFKKPKILYCLCDNGELTGIDIERQRWAEEYKEL